jgi:sirohydrochlorin cobaltochelatase
MISTSSSAMADPKATASASRLARAALVLCAHGIRGGVGAAAEHAERIARRNLLAEVRACALKGAPGLTETVAAIRAPELVFAPLLMAEAYTLDAMQRRLRPAANPSTRLILCQPVGSHPRLSDALTARALALVAGKAWRLADTALLIVGHGTERHPDSGGTALHHAGRIAAQGMFADVAVGFLDEPPRVPEALKSLRAQRCVAIGLFVDAGEHGEEDVPALLAPAGDRAAYAGPIGPDPLVTDLILEQVHAAVEKVLAA